MNEIKIKNTILDRFIPRTMLLREPHEVSRTKLTVLYSFAFASCGIVFVPLFYLFGLPQGAFAIGLCDLLILVHLFILHRCFSSSLAANWTIFNVYWLLGYLATLNGGLQAPSLIWLASLSITGTVLAGHRWGFFWAFLSILQAAFFYICSAFGYEFPQYFSAETIQVIHFVSLICLSLLILAFALFYEKFTAESTELIRSMAVSDELTKLLNRHGFNFMVDRQVKEAKRKNRKMVLIFADVDGLKDVNDKHGHGTGDRLLSDFSGILKRSFRDTDLIARIGGDEFVISTVEDKNATSIVLVTRLLEEIKNFNDERTRPYNVSVSIGVAFSSPNEVFSLESLIKKADQSMYQYKHKLRDQLSA